MKIKRLAKPMVPKDARNASALLGVGTARAAGLLASAQAAKHYEIARYGALVAWAEQLADKEVVELLRQTLDEEMAAESSLNRICADWISQKVRAA